MGWQLSGLRFMWENCIETVNKVKSGADGLGCIVAHSMGLGKTLQARGFSCIVLLYLSMQVVRLIVPYLLCCWCLAIVMTAKLS